MTSRTCCRRSLRRRRSNCSCLKKKAQVRIAERHQRNPPLRSPTWRVSRRPVRIHRQRSVSISDVGVPVRRGWTRRVRSSCKVESLKTTPYVEDHQNRKTVAITESRAPGDGNRLDRLRAKSAARPPTAVAHAAPTVGNPVSPPDGRSLT